MNAQHWFALSLITVIGSFYVPGFDPVPFIRYAPAGISVVLGLGRVITRPTPGGDP